MSTFCVRRTVACTAAATGWSGQRRPIGPGVGTCPRPYRIVSVCRSAAAKHTRGSPTLCTRLERASDQRAPLLTEPPLVHRHRRGHLHCCGPGVGACPRPHDPCRCTSFSAALSAMALWSHLRAPVWCTEPAIHACFWRRPSGIRSQCGTGVSKCPRPAQLAGADLINRLPPHCRLHCGARRRSTSSKICAPLGHDPAKAIARGILVGRGTRRCRWRPV